MTTLHKAAQQALEALETCDAAHPSDGGQQWYDEKLVEPAITALRAALAEPCPCGDRPADQCPGEWEPGCDLGNNPKYAKQVEPKGGGNLPPPYGTRVADAIRARGNK